MSTLKNDVFRLVNLRGIDNKESIDPYQEETRHEVEGPVVIRLSQGDFPFAEPPEAILHALKKTMAGASKETSTELADATSQLYGVSADGKSAEIDENSTFGDSKTKVKDLHENAAFMAEYADAYNRWLLNKYLRSEKAVIEELAKKVRVGYFLLRLGSGEKRQATRERTRRATRVLIKLPKESKKSAVSMEAQRSDNNRAAVESESTTLLKTYQNSRDHFFLVKKVDKVFNDVAKQTFFDGDEPRKRTTVYGKTNIGLTSRISSFIYGHKAKVETVNIAAKKPFIVDSTFKENVKLLLGPEETQFFEALLDDTTDQPITVVAKTLANHKAKLSAEANEHLNAFHNKYDAGRWNLTPPTQTPLPPDDGAVQALGWGDLLVAKERLVGYQAHELAHIENILSGETKKRDHNRTQVMEETFETESIETNETEQNLQTTSRHELQTESEKAIAQDFSIKTGVNTSGRYGLTKVETSLDAGFKVSKKESQSSTMNIAKEIVSKAVERTFKSVREMRRHTVTITTEELNSHELRNEGSTGISPTDISGVYKWVEKLQEVQLMHYGTRMMIEFSIPEPALSIVGNVTDLEVEKLEPTAITFDASNVNETNYLAYANQYEAANIEPPPPEYIYVGYAWSSTPNEKDDENKSEDTLSESIAIPSNYEPAGFVLNGAAHPSDTNDFQVRIQIADKQIAADGVGNFTAAESIIAAESGPWPQGIPVSMTAHGHFDKTLSINIVILCSRLERRFMEWQIDTYASLQAGYRRLKDEFDEARDAAKMAADFGILVQSDSSLVNRRTEREELQKWATTILRRDSLEFDSVVNVGAGVEKHAEIDPVRADRQAPYVRFYEEAFEWEHMSYFFYPYFWGRRSDWRIRQSLRHDDFRYESFLRAGSSRVIVPVTPGHESSVLYYLSNPAKPEKDRIVGAETIDGYDEIPDSVADSEYDTMWLELMLDKNKDLAIGSGYLNVQKSTKSVEIVESEWQLSNSDIGRELFIEGDLYIVESITGETTFTITEEYTKEDNPMAVYASGSVPFGPPWTVALPTNLVILSDNTDKLHS